MLRKIYQKQDRIDNSLITDNKEIPYAINESMTRNRVMNLAEKFPDTLDILSPETLETGVNYYHHGGSKNIINYPPGLNMTAFNITTNSFF